MSLYEKNAQNKVQNPVVCRNDSFYGKCTLRMSSGPHPLPEFLIETVISDFRFCSSPSGPELLRNTLFVNAPAKGAVRPGWPMCAPDSSEGPDRTRVRDGGLPGNLPRRVLPSALFSEFLRTVSTSLYDFENFSLPNAEATERHFLRSPVLVRDR